MTGPLVFKGHWPAGILGGPDHNIKGVPREFPGATFMGLRTVAGIVCEYWVTASAHHLAPVSWEFVVATEATWDGLVELVTDAQKEVTP